MNSRELLTSYTQYLRALEGRSHLLAQLFDYGAPTLFGRKPAVLFRFGRNGPDLRRQWLEYRGIFNRQLGLTCQIEYHELLDERSGISVLFFRRERLSSTLRTPENRLFLRERGFAGEGGVDLSLAQLSEGFGKGGFPHEVGIFLGIPAEDVRGFVAHRGQNYLFNGYWKVYSNPEKALRTFREYDRLRTLVTSTILQLGKT